MKRLNYFSTFEKMLWLCSVSAISLTFFLLDRSNWLAFAESLIGATSLLFNAKGNPFGQFLTIVFSVSYGIISYSCAYYGEMITYLGMTAPMALLALIAWLRNPYQGNRAQVAVRPIRKKEVFLMLMLTAVVSVVFYFIMSAWQTANLIPSTISIATSFMAVALTYLRSPYFALAYASNDLVLIVLWTLASLKDRSYVSVLACFVVFLVNDLYGFINWKRMEKDQAEPGISST